MKFFEFLKLKRIELGYSTRQLGGKVLLSGSYISLVENGKTSTPPTEETLEKLVISLKLTELEKEKLYKMVDDQVLPQRLKTKITNLENELKNSKKQLNIQNNTNNGHIVVGNKNTIKNSYAGTELGKELNELSEKEKEKVLKFINEYIK